LTASLPLIAVRLACAVFAPSARYVANAPVNPAAEKSTVAADVASIIVYLELLLLHHLLQL
jgi:hypothetical protein